MIKKEIFRLAIDCDDAATDLKVVIYEYLKQSGIAITDLNYSGSQSAMYPEIG